MKKLIFLLMLLVNSDSFASSLIWATGNDYFNTCADLNQYNTEKCLTVAAAYFDATLYAISIVYFMNIYHINRNCFTQKYELNKITAGGAHNMIMGYLKSYPNNRDFSLSENFYDMFWKNYPPPTECHEIRKEKT